VPHGSLLYVKRWLQAPLQLPDGTLQKRDAAPRRGQRISPVLANLFLHYAFDRWMAREFPPSRSSATWMTRWCTAKANPGP